MSIKHTKAVHLVCDTRRKCEGTTATFTTENDDSAQWVAQMAGWKIHNNKWDGTARQVSCPACASNRV